MTPFEAAVQYHVRCELFDRKVCSGPMGRDGVLPANPREQAIINSNALSERSRAAREARVELKYIDLAIRDKRTHDEAERRLREMPPKLRSFYYDTK